MFKIRLQDRVIKVVFGVLGVVMIQPFILSHNTILSHSALSPLLLPILCVQHINCNLHVRGDKTPRLAVVTESDLSINNRRGSKNLKALIAAGRSKIPRLLLLFNVKCDNTRSKRHVNGIPGRCHARPIVIGYSRTTGG